MLCMRKLQSTIQTKIVALESEIKRQKEGRRQDREIFRAEVNRIREDAARQIESLTNKIVELASRPPTVVDSSAIIATIGETLTKLLVGPQMPQEEREKVAQQIDMAALGLGNDIGVNGGKWAPEHEFDTTLEDQSQWPTRGGWYNPNPSMMNGAPSTMMKDVQVTEDGVQRSDGTTMFRSGDGLTTPPAGGVE